jgi:hypothetical protein
MATSGSETRPAMAIEPHVNSACVATAGMKTDPPAADQLTWRQRQMQVLDQIKRYSKTWTSQKKKTGMGMPTQVRSSVDEKGAGDVIGGRSSSWGAEEMARQKRDANVLLNKGKGGNQLADLTLLANRDRGGFSVRRRTAGDIDENGEANAATAEAKDKGTVDEVVPFAVAEGESMRENRERRDKRLGIRSRVAREAGGGDRGGLAEARRAEAGGRGREECSGGPGSGRGGTRGGMSTGSVGGSATPVQRPARGGVGSDGGSKSGDQRSSFETEQSMFQQRITTVPRPPALDRHSCDPSGTPSGSSALEDQMSPLLRGGGGRRRSYKFSPANSPISPPSPHFSPPAFFGGDSERCFVEQAHNHKASETKTHTGKMVKQVARAEGAKGACSIETRDDN